MRSAFNCIKGTLQVTLQVRTNLWQHHLFKSLRWGWFTQRGFRKSSERLIRNSRRPFHNSRNSLSIPTRLACKTRKVRRCLSFVSCTVPSGESPSFRSKSRTQLTKRPPRSSSRENFFVRVLFGGVPSTAEEVVRVRLCCLLS